MSTYLYALGASILMLGISLFIGKKMGFLKNTKNSSSEPKANRPTKDEIIKYEESISNN